MRDIKSILDEIVTEAADVGLEAELHKRQTARPRRACCNADVEIPPLPWFPLCVRCNGTLTRGFQPFPGRHRRGHNERCLWDKGFSYGIKLERGKQIAVIYKHSVYDEPDWLALARDALMTAGRDAGMPIGKMTKWAIEFEPHCYVHLIDEYRQDQESRGRRFDIIYVMPPARDIHANTMRSLAPNGELKYLEKEDAKTETTQA